MTQCSLCKSVKGSSSNDYCIGISTGSDEFYVMVYSGEAVKNVTLRFSGKNLVDFERSRFWEVNSAVKTAQENLWKLNLLFIFLVFFWHQF